MLRFVTFVDGSNLDGVLKHLNLRVDDYGAFYRHVFEQSVHYWGRTFADGAAVADRPALADLLVRRGQDGRVGPERPQGRGAAADPVRDEPAAPRRLHRGREPAAARPAAGPPDRGSLEPLLQRDPRVVREQAARPRAEEAVLSRRPGRHRLRRDPPGGALEGRPAASHRQREGARHQPGRRHGRAPGHLRHRPVDLGRRRRHSRASTTSRAGRSTWASPSSAAARRPISPPRERRRGSRSPPTSSSRFTRPTCCGATSPIAPRSDYSSRLR